MRPLTLPLLAALLVAATGCIENDIPYPHTQGNFTALEVSNQLRATVIDSTQRVATIYLNERADIRAVEVTRWALSPGTVFPDSAMFRRPLDLSEPIDVTLKVYYDFTWTIRAVQTIERYFTVGSQIGQSVIDPEAHTVTAAVPTGMDLASIEVRSLKLAGPEAKYDPDIAGRRVDFTRPLTVKVTEFGRTTDWTITIVTTDVSVQITQADAWTNVAWIYAVAQEGKANGIQYRPQGADEWIDVPADWITHDGGSFTARIIHLDSQATYEARAISDEEFSAPVTFTTGDVAQLPNSLFRNWWLDGKVWCPWMENGEAFWGTGNKGATTLGDSNSVPIADPDSPTGYEGASLETKFVGISVFGKLAAGNLFAGSYVRTDGTNGVLSMGREFTQRPTRLTGKMKYICTPITDAREQFTSIKGQPDTCIVWVALVDSDEPFEVRTNPDNRQLFSSSLPIVVAYGQVQYGETIEDYIDFSAELNYVATNRRPRYILVTASASKYGDYFTGGRGSTLCVKDFNLEYDY